MKNQILAILWALGYVLKMSFTNTVSYLLNGFGYKNLHDLSTTLFKIFYMKNFKISLSIVVGLGTVREFIEQAMGMDIYFLVAFVMLICAEFQTGVKVAMRNKKERIKSRKVGRMILKIGVYIQILWVLEKFASKAGAKNFFGIDVNPFEWLYFIVLVGIVFQMVISWLENLSSLGYHEARGLHGVVLRKFNKWFEFDGTKDGDNIQ
jgi:hypothetical protein